MVPLLAGHDNGVAVAVATDVALVLARLDIVVEDE